MLRMTIPALIATLALGCQKPQETVKPEPDEKPPPRVEGDDVQIKVTPVAGSVYMLEGRGGNIGALVGNDGVLMIDDQFAPLAPKIRAAIAGIATSAPGIEYLINTHYHGDHTGGNPEFGKEARIIAHTNVRKRVSTDQVRGGRTAKALPKEGWPVITYDDGVSIHFNGEEVKVMHLPTGHTDGDSVVHFTGSNVLHMGDLFFNGRFPFVDLGGGGDVEGYIANLTQVIEMLPAGVKIIPGHGPLASADDLKTYRASLQETVDIVRKHMAEGKTLEQIQSAGFPAKFAEWGSGFINTETWIATIHESLTR